MIPVLDQHINLILLEEWMLDFVYLYKGVTIRSIVHPTSLSTIGATNAISMPNSNHQPKKA